MDMGEIKENDSAEGKDRYSNTRSMLKPALITLAIVAVVVVIVFLIMITPGEESVPDFLKRWEKVVESGSQKAYEQICSDNFREKSGDLYEETKKLISGQKVDVSIDDSNIEKVRLDEKRYVIKHIPMFLSKDDIHTHEKLAIKKTGLIKRRWEVDLEERHFSKAAAENLERIAEGQPAESAEEVGETPLDTDFRIRQTLEVWRVAWEDKELDTYIDCYADYADITRVTVVDGKEERTKLTKDKLREHIDRLNKNYSKVMVELSDLKVEGDTATAKANFLQEYSAWGDSGNGIVYHDLGMKELQFVKHDVQWKIANENWTLYKDVPTYPKLEY